MVRKDIHVTALVAALIAIAVAVGTLTVRSTTIAVNKAGVGNATAYVPPESSARPDGARFVPTPNFGLAIPDPARVDQAGLSLIENFEGFLGCPYWDSYGGVWTIGFGYTIGVTRYTACESRAQAQAQLQAVLATQFEWAINSLAPQFVPTQRERDSLASFIWNTGPGTITRGTAIGDDLIAHKLYAATSVMLEYDHAGGVVLAGLVTRRQDEVRLFREGEREHPAPKLTAAQKRRAATIAAIARLDRYQRANHCSSLWHNHGGRSPVGQKHYAWCRGWQNEKEHIQRELTR